MTLRSSPHIETKTQVGHLMRQVVYALLPGTFIMSLFLGWGVWINIILAISFALMFETLVMLLRKRPILQTLEDNSALVTGWLLALCLPPLTPWWIILVATGFAIIFAKQLYGGLGYNVFNPAMVGYVVVLLSFPREVTQWLQPMYLWHSPISLLDALKITLSGGMAEASNWDALTTATPLDSIRITLAMGKSLTDAQTETGIFALTEPSIVWIGLGFLAGGMWLLYKRVADWRIPLAILVTLMLIALPFWWFDPAQYASPLLHLFAGATILGAFFIATDPVSASTTPLGRILFGVGIGIFIFVIRTWGGYPDAVAFAILLMNAAVPLLDHYTRPRVFGNNHR